jgi:quercetin dioxygenase-like cupin family protein
MSLANFETTAKKADMSEIFDILGPRVQFLTAFSDADDDFILIAADFPPGTVVPIHSHRDREIFYILAGELQGLWVDRWVALVAGDVFDVPGNIKHAWRNVSGSPVSLLVVTTTRMGRFFRDIGRPLATVKPGAPDPTDLEHLFDRARAHGYWMGSPADNAAVGISLG